MELSKSQTYAMQCRSGAGSSQPATRRPGHRQVILDRREKLQEYDETEKLQKGLRDDDKFPVEL